MFFVDYILTVLKTKSNPEKTIPWIAVGRDVNGQARSGTGKNSHILCSLTLSRIDFNPLNAYTTYCNGSYT